MREARLHEIVPIRPYGGLKAQRQLTENGVDVDLRKLTADDLSTTADGLLHEGQADNLATVARRNKENNIPLDELLNASWEHLQDNPASAQLARNWKRARKQKKGN